MSELKPCPFCGNPDLIHPDELEGEPFYVRCSDCLSDGPCEDTVPEAVEAWNARSTPKQGEDTGGLLACVTCGAPSPSVEPTQQVEPGWQPIEDSKE